MRFHRLAGSGGSYGFPRVTEIARSMEHWIVSETPPTPADADRFDQAVEELGTAFDEVPVIVPPPTVLGRIPGFGYRALLLMGESGLRSQLVDSLGEAGFLVVFRSDATDPWNVPPSERPDLVVIGTDIDSDPLKTAHYWSAVPSPDRPRAVVLADPANMIDRLHGAAAGVDAFFGLNALPRGLVQYARALAQIGAKPASVMVVEDDPSQAQLCATWLREISADVTTFGSAQAARNALLHEAPDIVLLDIDLPDIDGYALARLMRQDPRLALVPIVFLTARQTLADRMAGLRAGADDFLAKPVDRDHLLQLVLTRTERGRRVRELVHRDGLTGALNHATLMSELDHAISFSARHGEALSFLMLDLDHFKRVNDTHGHMVGDQVLMHTASVFRNNIRGSDMLGRYGGEEFGIILRRCPPANARAIAEKLRAALEATPMRNSGGDDIQVKVSIGVASYPGSGSSAAEVAAAADAALYRAKSSGRNRVEMG